MLWKEGKGEKLGLFFMCGLSLASLEYKSERVTYIIQGREKQRR